MVQNRELDQLPPPGNAAGARAGTAGRATFSKSRKTLKHDNTFAPKGFTTVTSGVGNANFRSPRTARRQFTDFDTDTEDFNYKYSANTTENGPGPHIKGVHSYIFSDGIKRPNYNIDPEVSAYLSHKPPPLSAVSKILSDFEDFEDSGLGSARRRRPPSGSSGGSAFQSRVSAKSSVYQHGSSAAAPSLFSVGPLVSDSPLHRRRASIAVVGGSSSSTPAGLPPRRAPPLIPPASLSFARRRSPSPVYQSQVDSSYHSQTPSLRSRPISPSPIRRSFASPHLATAPPGHISRRRASVISYSPVAPVHAPRAYAVPPQPPPPPPSYHSVVTPELRRHSVAVSSASRIARSSAITPGSTYVPPVRRVPQPVPVSRPAVVPSGGEIVTSHGPVHSRRFPERYALVKTTLRPVLSEPEAREREPDTDLSIVPYLPRYLGRRHSLDAGMTRVGVDTSRALDIYKGREVATTTTSREKRLVSSKAFRPRPIHPPITRPVAVDSKRGPLYDVDLYYITRQQLIDQPDITSKFQPLKNRLQQIGGVHLLPGARALQAEPGEIPHFTPDYIPYEPAYRAPRLRPGGPLYIRSVGEDPREVSRSELEPHQQDGVVAVMVGHHTLFHVREFLKKKRSGFSGSYSLVCRGCPCQMSTRSRLPWKKGLSDFGVCSWASKNGVLV